MSDFILVIWVSTLFWKSNSRTLRILNDFSYNCQGPMYDSNVAHLVKTFGIHSISADSISAFHCKGKPQIRIWNTTVPVSNASTRLWVWWLQTQYISKTDVRYYYSNLTITHLLITAQPCSSAWDVMDKFKDVSRKFWTF